MIVVGGLFTPEEGMDTWALSLAESPAWSPLIDGGQPPSGQQDHTAVYDSERGRMVIFGGWSNQFDNASPGTWTLSLAGDPAWSYVDILGTQTPGTTFPDGRQGHSAIYDPVRDRMIVFGGEISDGTVLNDVWALSFGGVPAWSQLAPLGVAPSRRLTSRAIYDPGRDRMILFGGSGG